MPGHTNFKLLTMIERAVPSFYIRYNACVCCALYRASHGTDIATRTGYLSLET